MGSLVHMIRTTEGRRSLSYWMVGGGLSLFYAVVRGAAWQGSAELHTLMEALATLLAVIVGGMALVRFYTGRSNTFLIVGVGFLGTGFLDGYHALVTSTWFKDLMPSDLGALIPWSWIASRAFLAGVLLLSWVAWRHERKSGRLGSIGVRAVYAGAAVLTLLSFLFFAFAPLPRAYYPELMFHRPEEFVPALLFGIALIGYLRKGHWRHDAFEHWLVLALIVNLVAQTVFMSFSGQLFDLEFDAAHALKKVSYLLVLMGLFVSMYANFKQVEREVAERKRAEGALRDTQQKLLRQAEDLAVSRDKAEEASRAKGDFLACMSHEIRTPMNGVLGMTNLLRGTELSTEQREYVESLYSSGEGLLSIINDILDFSKVEAGKLEIEPIPFDLQVAIGEVADLLLLKSEEKELELIVRYVAGTPRYLVGDPGRIRQIVLNLAGNAIKFTHAGHVLLEVQAVEQNEQEVCLKISVHDTGVGMGEAAQNRLFQPFHQADASTTRKFGGTGLGLAICKQLVGLMGGKIGVHSTPGVGSMFWFTITLPRDADREAVSVPNADLSGVRVLVVDDTEMNRRVLGEQLAVWGMRPEGVGSGAVAIERLRHAVAEGDPFEIAILDGQMPGMDGMEVAHVIENDPALCATLLVLLVSSRRRGDGRRAEEVGFAAFLVKPARPDALRDVLTTVLADVSAGDATRGLVTRHSVAEARACVPRPEVGAADDPPCRVLLAEDNIVNQKVAMRMLENLGCRVDVAANGKEAVRMWSELPYDIVFMDCQMPEMDGYVATGVIREQEEFRHTPIVAITANVLEGDKELCLAAGMDDFVGKPISVAALEEILERWVWGSDARREPVGQGG